LFSSGQDAAWIDKVSFVRGSFPAISVEYPEGIRLASGSPLVWMPTAMVGGSSSLAIVVRNIGEGQLTGLAVSVSGEHSMDFVATPPPSDLALDFSDSHSIGIQFVPSQHGIREGVLELVSNDGSNGPLTLRVQAMALTPREAWRLQHFKGTSNAGSGADRSDPDHDGASNLLEYAFGTDPNSPASLIHPTWSIAERGPSRHIQLDFPLEADDVAYIVEASEDLANWLEIERFQGTQSQTPPFIDPMELGSPLAPKRFLRLKIESTGP
jgi:hypothetical protein